ncbi:hypothetical protein EH223_12750 [candidate division KSB1 bacterium]|nr:hypothetical protein [candidate division KSB1 bacterium]RQW02353.1 MAG: hypothetical protein EH223_12750 [candidate division KSB1 bacterium]
MTLVSLFTACALDMRAVEQSDNPLSLYFADTLSESGIYAAAVEKFLPHVIEKTSTDEIRKLSTSDVLAQG